MDVDDFRFKGDDGGGGGGSGDDENNNGLSIVDSSSGIVGHKESE